MTFVFPVKINDVHSFLLPVLLGLLDQQSRALWKW